jgi:hypothetical protein
VPDSWDRYTSVDKPRPPLGGADFII